MAVTYTYPESAALQLVAQELAPRIKADRPIFDLFPTGERDESELVWEQRDNYLGLQQIRGLNGEPPRVKRTGTKRYVMQPGVYGEFEPINEAELTRRSQVATWGRPVQLDDLVAPIQDKLLQRMYDRIEWMGWTLLATGTFSVAGPNGAILQTDSYTTQTFAASPAWATFATATPLGDFRAVQLLGRGYSVDFGAAAKAYMNQATMNNLLSNTNNADLFGRRTAGLGTFNNLGQINQLLAGDNLPQLVPYDAGYLDDSGAFQLFVPNNKVIVVGKRRMGDPVGEYVFTRNINHDAGGMRPGPYNRVIDLGEQRVPREFQVHLGHNGGYVLYHPAAVVIMTV